MIDVPVGWAAVFSRAVTAGVTAFVVLQAKEWFDAGRFDTAGTGADAVLIAGGLFALSAIRKLAKA
ncbi:MAG: hypothetical protein HY560_10380 [Gemmatimonadetes bacterium]|nr:hypothetical protein [Gemmatimonadota bacterium]